MDRSCAINVTTRSLYVRATSEHTIRKIAVSLQNNYGVHNTLTCRDDCWEIRIGSREALNQYAEQIGFEDPEKTAKLETILESYS